MPSKRSTLFALLSFLLVTGMLGFYAVADLSFTQLYLLMKGDVVSADSLEVAALYFAHFSIFFTLDYYRSYFALVCASLGSILYGLAASFHVYLNPAPTKEFWLQTSLSTPETILIILAFALGVTAALLFMTGLDFKLSWPLRLWRMKSKYPLLYGAYKGDLTFVKSEWARYPTAIVLDRATRRTALHWAADSGQNEIAQFLLGNSLKLVHLVDYNKRTALHLAILSKHLNVAASLIKSGASLDAEDNWSETPVDLLFDLLSIEEQDSFIMDCKIELREERKSFSILVPLIEHDNFTRFRDLIEKHKLSVRGNGEDRLDLLMCAAQAGAMKIAKFLIQSYGFDPNKKNASELSALDLAPDELIRNELENSVSKRSKSS